MAINSQKLLPLAKSSTAIVKSAGSSISDGKNKGGALIKSKTINVGKLIPYKKEQEEKKDERYGAIIKSLSTISSIIKSDFTSEQKKTQKEDTEKKEEDSKKREENIEKKERPKGLSKLSGISLPKFGFLDAVKRYFLFTFLGWLFTNTQQYLPQLLKILDIIKPVAQFAETLFKGLFDGFVTFIDKGYEKYDEVRNFAKNLGGEGAQKVFDDLSKNLNTLIITTILVAGALANLGEKQNPSTSQKPPGPGERVPPKGGASRPGGVPRTSTRRPVPTTSGGRPLGRLDIRNPLREKPRITGSGGGRAGRLDIRNPLRQKPRITGSSGSNRGLLRAVRPFLKRIPLPVVGALIDFGLSVALGENPGRAAFRAIGAGILGAVGAAIGSVVPVAGNMIGGIAGGMAGDWVGGALYDMFFGGKKPSKGNNGSVQRKASGGRVSSKPTSTSKPSPRRTLKIAPKKPLKKPPQISKPGKDVGGEKNIKLLYIDPTSETRETVTRENFFPTELFRTYEQYVQAQQGARRLKTSEPSPYKALTSTAKILKQIPLIGGIMGAAVDVALGQKLELDVQKSISSSIGYLVETLANERTNINITSLQRDIVQMADGGYVPPSRRLRTSQNNLISSDMISKIIGPNIEQRVNEALKGVQEEVQKARAIKDQEEKERRERLEGGGDSLDVEGGGVVTGGNADFWALAAIASLENSNPQGQADVAQAIYNRVVAGRTGVRFGQRSNTVLGHIIAPGQFQPVRETGDHLGMSDDQAYALWGAIRDKETAIQAVSKHVNGGRNAARMVEAAARNITNTRLIESARSFIGGRTDFSATGAYTPQPGAHSIVQRAGHDYGFFVGQGSIQYGRRNPSAAVVPDLGGRVIMPDANISGIPGGGRPITIRDIYPLGPEQGRDRTGEPGIDFTFQGGKTLALYPGRVIDIGSQINPRTGRGYGNYVLVESIDPNNSKKFTILYAHFGEGKIFVREGQQIQAGTPIGVQPNRNKGPGYFTGSGSGEHTSADFYEPDGRTAYRNGDRLVSQVLASFRGTTRGYPIYQPPQQPPQQRPGQPSQPETVEGMMGGLVDALMRPPGSPTRPTQGSSSSTMIPMDGVGTALEKKGSIPFTHNGETYYFRYDPTIGRPHLKIWKPTIGAFPDLGGTEYDVKTGNRALLESAMQKIRSMYKFQGGGPISIAPSKSNRPIPNSYASYENYGSGMMFAIQPVMIKEVAISMPSKTPPLMFPSGNLNNKDTYAYHSLSRG